MGHHLKGADSSLAAAAVSEAYHYPSVFQRAGLYVRKIIMASDPNSAG
jgi:hypothetical protein